jgi:hypothetical protein
MCLGAYSDLWLLLLFGVGTLCFIPSISISGALADELRRVVVTPYVTMVGLFSAAITRVEWDAPYREAIAAKRLARMTRAERRMAQSMVRRKGG